MASFQPANEQLWGKSNASCCTISHTHKAHGELKTTKRRLNAESTWRKCGVSCVFRFRGSANAASRLLQTRVNTAFFSFLGCHYFSSNGMPSPFFFFSRLHLRIFQIIDVKRKRLVQLTCEWGPFKLDSVGHKYLKSQKQISSAVLRFYLFPLNGIYTQT